MSLLEKILVTAGEAEMVDLNSKVNEITEMVSALKMDVMETMENTYIRFMPFFEENKKLLKQADSLSDEMSDVHSKVENQIKRDLANSTGELQNLKDALQETTLSLHLAKHLLSLHNCIIEAKQMQKLLRFHDAAKKIRALKDSLLDCKEEVKCLDIYLPLQHELERIHSRFSYNTLEEWKPYITWQEIDIDVDKLGTEVTLKISKGQFKEQLVQALYNYELLYLEIRKFGDKLLNRILNPIVTRQSRVYVSDSGEVLTVLTGTVQNNLKKPTCFVVFSNLTTVFTFVHDQLDVKIGDGESTFITELGEEISDQFCDYFIKHCLDETVPKCQDELVSYSSKVDELIAFEALLHEKGFLDKENKRLLEYAENVDILFANKTCQCYLEDAKAIMKKDLYDIQEVGVQHSMQNEESARDATVVLPQISQNTFQFPLCQISKSTEELLELVRRMLNESSKSKSDLCAVKLFHTSRQIFKMYCDIVPLYHSKLLETIPQQAALLHNNCCYLAHMLMILGMEYETKHHRSLKNNIITFVDLVPPLQSIGMTVLRNQLNTQKKQLIDILRDSGLVTLIESPAFPSGIEKAIRQCTRQLALLQSVWQHVLPFNTYCKAIGYLCDAFVEELIHRVCSIGDISENTAIQLVQVFTIVQQKAPLVFEEPKEIYKHVKLWSKFSELTKLLAASLREVDERWADGKGPLAQEFTAGQIKQLIRALFSISDRRATLLARIK